MTFNRLHMDAQLNVHLKKPRKFTASKSPYWLDTAAARHGGPPPGSPSTPLAADPGRFDESTIRQLSPREMSSRAARVSVRSERRQAAGAIPTMTRQQKVNDYMVLAQRPPYFMR